MPLPRSSPPNKKRKANESEGKVADDEQLVLYGYWRSSCSWRVRIALAVKNIPYESRFVHLVNNGGEQHSEAHSNRNAMEMVPTLQLSSGANVSQSMAILEYLEETYPDIALLPSSSVDRAKVRQLAQMIASDTQPLQNLRVIKRVESLLDTKSRVEWGAHWIKTGLTAFEKEISKTAGTYCFGNKITLADLCLIPQMYNARRFKCDVSGWPTILRVEASLNIIPAFQAAAPDQQGDAVVPQ